LLITNDQKTIVTSSRDKKIKVYDWINDKVLATLSGHSSNVESIIFSFDEKYLFSGGDDKRVVVWHTGLWTELCYLEADFPVYTIQIT